MQDIINETGNGKVTLALVQNEIKHIGGEIAEMRGEVREWRADQEQRIRCIEAKATKLETRQDRLLDDVKEEIHQGDQASKTAGVVGNIIAAVTAIGVSLLQKPPGA